MKKINNERKEFLDRENFSSQNEMVSLNETINQEFFVEQLEERLETDPLAVGGLFDLFTQNQIAADGFCGDYTNGEVKCSWYWY